MLTRLQTIFSFHHIFKSSLICACVYVVLCNFILCIDACNHNQVPGYRTIPSPVSLFFIVPTQQGFSTLTLLTYETRSFFVCRGWGVALCIVRCLAASLTFTQQMPVVLPPHHCYDNQNCFQTLPNVPWEASCTESWWDHPYYLHFSSSSVTKQNSKCYQISKNHISLQSL